MAVRKGIWNVRLSYKEATFPHFLSVPTLAQILCLVHFIGGPPRLLCIYQKEFDLKLPQLLVVSLYVVSNVSEKKCRHNNPLFPNFKEELRAI